MILTTLYFSFIIIMVIKPTKMIWSGHLARMEEMRNVYILSTITKKETTRET